MVPTVLLPTVRAKALRRSGLTLIELLVVLLILAILTTVAIQSTAGLVDQARYEATQRTLQNVQEAIVGPGGQREPDGTLLISGFVADVGRLPNAVGTDPATQLQELWANPSALAPFTLQAAPSDPQVVVPCGWRGPYLQLQPGSAQLYDGWGNSFALLQADAVTGVPVGQPIPVVRSLGADNASGGTGYAADADVLLLSTQAAAPVNRYQAVVTGTVYVLDAQGNRTNPDPANGPITVRFFGPNPLTGGVLETAVTVTPTTGVPVTYSFNTTIGPRVVRAYQGTATTQKKSTVTRLTVQPGGQIKDLLMQ